MPKSSPCIIRERFQEALKSTEKTQVTLAQEIGISRSTLGRYLAGSPITNQATLYKIGVALDVNEHWLVGSDVPKRRSPEQKNYDKLLSTYMALQNDEQLYELVSSLANASENQRYFICQLLGNPRLLDKYIKKTNETAT